MNFIKNNSRILVLSAFIIVAASLRLFLEIPNFSPIAAMALFGGAMFANKKMAFILPLTAMLLSDVAIELIRPGFGFHNTMVFVYIAFALAALVGILISKDINPGKILFGALFSSVLFFLITNFGSWVMPYNGAYTYPLTFAGLLESYAAGVPFYRYTIVGDLIFTTVLFGCYYLLQFKMPVLQKVKA
jgi:hypothetical protein